MTTVEKNLKEGVFTLFLRFTFLNQCLLVTITRSVVWKPIMAGRGCGGAECSPHGSWETGREVEKDLEIETDRRR